MIIDNLKLKNYRNYKNLDINLDDKLNIFIGDNAQGKSNILESIYVLAVTKSYLGVKDKDLIKEDCEFATLESDVLSHGNMEKLKINLTNNSKKVRINSKEVKRYIDYISKFRVLLFSPDNISMIKDSPNVRRKYLNVEISQMSNEYVRNLQNYNLILGQRNEFLKICRETGRDNDIYLEVLNKKFVSLAVSIMVSRYKFISSINNYIKDIYKELMGVENLNIKYVSSIDISDNITDMEDKFYEKLKKNYEKEKIYGVTLIGPHRDDFKFYIGNRDMIGYASQGQLRAAVLSLKLSEIEIFKSNTSEYPILLLDDIFSELDIKKKNRLIQYMIDDVQTIITTTDLNMIDDSLVSKAKIFEISKGEVVNMVERKVIQNG